MGSVVPNRATFVYSYSVSSILTDRATVFLKLYSETGLPFATNTAAAAQIDTMVLVAKAIIG